MPNTLETQKLSQKFKGHIEIIGAAHQLYSHKLPVLHSAPPLLLPRPSFSQVLTKDSVTVSVDGVVYYRVQNATLAVANITNADAATRLLAQTTLRNVLGTKNLAEILSDREEIAHSMQVESNSTPSQLDTYN